MTPAQANQLMIDAVNQLTGNISTISNFNAIAYNGKLEKILKALFGIAFKDSYSSTQWIAMDKRFNGIEEDMTIYLKNPPCVASPYPLDKIISVELKHTLDIDSSDCIKSAAKAIRQVSTYTHNKHRYIIHFLSVHPTPNSVFSKAPQEVSDKYPDRKYSHDLADFYTNLSGAIGNQFQTLAERDIELYRDLTIQKHSTLTVVCLHKSPLIIYSDSTGFKIECYIFRI